MPRPMTAEEREQRSEQLRAQKEIGRRLRVQMAEEPPDFRMADVAIEIGIDPTVFSAVINGRRVWTDGVEDLKDQVAQAVERLRKKGVAA